MRATVTLGAWRQGQTGTLTVTVTQGDWPIPTFTVDIPNDGLPAWQVVVPDARPAITATIGPFARAQTTTVTTTLLDARGCTFSTTQPVTVTP